MSLMNHFQPKKMAKVREMKAGFFLGKMLQLIQRLITVPCFVTLLYHGFFQEEFCFGFPKIYKFLIVGALVLRLAKKLKSAVILV